MFMEEETVGIMFPCGSVDAVNSIGTNKFPTRIRFITERLTIFISYRSEIICTCRSDVAILVIIFRTISQGRRRDLRGSSGISALNCEKGCSKVEGQEQISKLLNCPKLRKGCSKMGGQEQISKLLNCPKVPLTPRAGFDPRNRKAF